MMKLSPGFNSARNTVSGTLPEIFFITFTAAIAANTVIHVRLPPSAPFWTAVRQTKIPSLPTTAAAQTLRISTTVDFFLPLRRPSK